MGAAAGAVVAPVRLSRADRVRANDEAIRTATAAMIVDDGWDAVTFTGVAQRAGLTVGAVYGRAESPAELGIDLWENVAGAWLRDAIGEVLTQARAGNASGVRAGLRHWETDRDRASLTVELMIASLFDDDLAEVIGVDARRTLARWCVPSARVTAAEAAAAALVCSFTFGRALAVRGGVAPAPLAMAQYRVLARHFAAPPARGALPRPVPLRWVRPMDDLDSARRALFRGTIDVVGRVGYRRATIARIARASGVPRSSVLSQYPDKPHLVGAAIEAGLIPPGEVWSQYSDVVAEHGPAIARAMFLADFLKPRNAPLWAVNLELARSARVHEELRSFHVAPNVLEQTHFGVMLAASMIPRMGRLPFAGPFGAGTAT